MHLQVKAKPNKSGMSVHDDDDDNVTVSATYEPGALVEILQILKDGGFNLRTASGSNVEFGGEFTFWVDARKGDKDEHVALEAAHALLLQTHDATVVEVHAKHLSDSRGTLLDFVKEVTKDGLMVQEINVGTPDDKGVPVQIFTAKARRRHPKL